MLRTPDTVSPSFLLVIPALNEAAVIATTLERALAARQAVLDHTPVRSMHVVLVNDGSTDDTQAIADRYPEVLKIRFEQNRGYGAAIKAGFQATQADIVGFMDADGTCEPRFCVDLINCLLLTGSDVVVGSRMNEGSAMPFIRQVGNWFFARLVGAVSGQRVSDSASGMRVMRRSSLRNLHPLPDGLHFTPAMTSLAVLDPRLRIAELPMPYRERVGQSKLRVLVDGVRFLFIILFSSALFNPIKSLALLGFLFLVLGLLLAWMGVMEGHAPLVTLTFGAAFAMVFLQAVFVGVLCHQALHMLIGPWRVSSWGEGLLQRAFWTRRMVRAGVIMLASGLAAYVISFALPNPWDTASAIGGALAVLAAGWTALGGVILRVLWAAKQRRMAELEDPYAVQSMPAARQKAEHE